MKQQILCFFVEGYFLLTVHTIFAIQSRWIITESTVHGQNSKSWYHDMPMPVNFHSSHHCLMAHCNLLKHLSMWISCHFLNFLKKCPCFFQGKFSLFILTCGLAPPHQNVPLDLPIIFIKGKPAINWKFVHHFISQIIQNHLRKNEKLSGKLTQAGQMYL